MNILIFGVPGVGKGTQAAILSERLGVPHVSTGAIFRSARDARKELGLLAQKYMDEGRLVPDEVTTPLALETIDGEDCRDGFILDGYPRNLAQAEALDQELTRQGRQIDHVVYLMAPEEEVIARMLKRGRVDDTEEVIRTRLSIYDSETSPVLDYFRKYGIVTEVNGVGDVDEVNDRILSVLNIRNGEPVAKE